MSDYPLADQHYNFTYWSGPVGQPGSHVTGWKESDGARSTYYSVTCTCDPYRRVSEEIAGNSLGDVREELDRMARDHAASHVEATTEEHWQQVGNRSDAEQTATDELVRARQDALAALARNKLTASEYDALVASVKRDLV